MDRKEDYMIYFDNASTTYPKPEPVYAGMDNFIRTHVVNAGRGQYGSANTANTLLRDTRDKMKTLLRCNVNHETVFTSSATEALNVILQGLDFSKIKTVYITHFEHNAVLRTLAYLQKQWKFDIIPLATTKKPLNYDLTAIQKQFETHKPDLIIMTHASNVCGLITPVFAITTLARPYEPITILDMAQTAGLLGITLSEFGVDAAIFAGHKTLYAPFGVAGFVMKKDLQLKPLLYGGTGLHSASLEMPESLPERFEAGSRNIYAIAGLSYALDWISETGLEEIYAKEQSLKKDLLACLSQFSNIHIVGKNDGIGIVSCVFDQYTADEIGQVLNRFDIAVRTGLHCSPNAHKFLGTAPAGTVRLSLGYFNTTNDIEELEKVLQYIKEHG